MNDWVARVIHGGMKGNAYLNYEHNFEYESTQSTNFMRVQSLPGPPKSRLRSLISSRHILMISFHSNMSPTEFDGQARLLQGRAPEHYWQV